MFSARGLNNFISDLRACTSHEEEQKRIDKELAKIRQKFTQNQTLHSYEKKKYAWKLIYMFMLGYDIDFGHMQVINLVSSTKYSEKCLGYLGCSILLKSSDELMTLVVNSIRNDLKSPEASHQCLALCCVANMGGSEFAEALSPDVVGLLMSSSCIAHVRKKAALCVRRLILPSPELIPLPDLEKRVCTLLSETHLGVVTSSASLAYTALTLHPKSFHSWMDICVTRLSGLVSHKACPRDYMYYNTPCPWLQVKLLRILSQFGSTQDQSLQEKISDVLRRILSRPLPGKGAKFNALYAVLIEAVHVVLAQEKQSDGTLKEQAVQLLARFISLSEPNIRYVGLDAMHRFVRFKGDSSAIKPYKDNILFSLKDADNSVRRRALDLLFSMCDAENALEIVQELVNYLSIAEGIIREEIVLKAAILAEKYAKNLRWYVDTVLQLITIAGSQVPDDVWHRVVQIVTNKEELQLYAAQVMFRALEPSHVDETTARFGAYVLGEFGYLICEESEMTCDKQFTVLHKHFQVCSLPTRCLILTALIKMHNLYEEIRPQISKVFEKCAMNMDLEMQQRACEYLCLHQMSDDLMKRVLEPMPIFPENRESGLIVRLRNQQKAGNVIEAVSDGKKEEIEVEEKSGKGTVDLLSMDMGFSGIESVRAPNPVSELMHVFGNAPLAPVESDMDVCTLEQIEKWHSALLLNAQGVLFENSAIQIGVKHEYRGSQGRMMFFVGNKSNDVLDAFQPRVDTSKCTSLPMQQAFRIQLESVAPQIGAKQQSKFQIMVECMTPFTQVPNLTISFRQNGKNVGYTLPLPCHVTSFLEPVKLSQEDFAKRWQALEGQDREQQQTWTSQNDVDIMHVRTILTENVKLGWIEGVPQNLNEGCCLAGSFRTGTAGPNGDKVSVGCLLRLQMNPSTKSFRLTTRAVHKDVSLALCHAIHKVLM